MPAPRPLKRSLTAAELSNHESDGSGGGAMPAGVKFVKSIAVSDSDGYQHVHTRPNRIVIVQFEGAKDNAAAAPTTDLVDIDA